MGKGWNGGGNITQSALGALEGRHPAGGTIRRDGDKAEQEGKIKEVLVRKRGRFGRGEQTVVVCKKENDKKVETETSKVCCVEAHACKERPFGT